MLGWVTMGEGKRANLFPAQLLGLPLWKLELPAPGRGWERRCARGLQRLKERRVTRVLTPPNFLHWPALQRYGFRPVDTTPLRCALTPVWVEKTLRKQRLDPRRCTVRLEGEGLSPELSQVARSLSLRVRALVIDTPGGEVLAARLRREFGLPVLPGRWVSDLTLTFAPGPILPDARFALTGGRFLPPDCEGLPLLTALWENGRIEMGEIDIMV